MKEMSVDFQMPSSETKLCASSIKNYFLLSKLMNSAVEICSKIFKICNYVTAIYNNSKKQFSAVVITLYSCFPKLG